MVSVERGEAGGTEGSGLSLIDLVVLAGAVFILALGNCS